MATIFYRHTPFIQHIATSTQDAQLFLTKHKPNYVLTSSYNAKQALIDDYLNQHAQLATAIDIGHSPENFHLYKLHYSPTKVELHEK